MARPVRDRVRLALLFLKFAKVQTVVLQMAIIDAVLRYFAAEIVRYRPRLCAGISISTETVSLSKSQVDF
ncbi:hypothetical protein AZE99_12645 [Sphingorhabdus sp. M41]|nr:hypothetical protein AZE99_12645 [Sphingorhabdus sp. M41]